MLLPKIGFLHPQDVTHCQFHMGYPHADVGVKNKKYPVTEISQKRSQGIQTRYPSALWCSWVNTAVGLESLKPGFAHYHARNWQKIQTWQVLHHIKGAQKSNRYYTLIAGMMIGTEPCKDWFFICTKKNNIWKCYEILIFRKY